MDQLDNRDAIREFLATRRAKLTPKQVGLPPGTRRRVPGLRREEVAVLAGVSTEWYVRLEKGHISGVSDEVLDAVARALRLDDAERSHLFNLARASKRPIGARRRAARTTIRPSVERLLASMIGTPAYVRNARNDVIACNDMYKALYAPLFDDPVQPPNLGRFTFLDPRAREFYPDWEGAADGVVALLRTEAGCNTHDRSLTDLVGELATKSSEFGIRWAAHDVVLHQSGKKEINHPVVGLIEVCFDVLDLPADPGQYITTYSAEPDSPSADAMAMLASWAAPALDIDNESAERR
ncbi:XRE family transcriptional regulator [Rhodococcus sp. WS1]|uniref:helix-turn-helix transcriptional regulator n=1 Tax=unclassified Rhodococcus (in: high G+C Gram-positive bacteria) TaxID=192944 RepID=UPI001144759E|nr:MULTISPECIES: helix-turn-helix transcriptional regulator [unclassified Rhodococcus (in: high G+C Gram-positive bacteria)]ROZ52903.1 XRE family transcriptional regulator [Rhodococcus sp. WS1]TQC35994.1 XRE family transcriptional regulator [Rhodococcus sp. WS7]